jgi:hypothetical protein
MDPITRKLVETVRQITETALVGVMPPIEGKPDVTQTLHVNDGKHYIVSSNANETLVFPSNERGRMASSTEVHAGETPRHGEEGFSVMDHHEATFKDFINTKR